LDRELPAVTLTTTGRALSDAMDVAFVEIKADLEPAIPAIDVASLNLDEKLKLAKSPNTPKKVLTELAVDGDVRIRRVVAVNPATPGRVLYELSQTDVDVEVCAKARKNFETAKSPWNERWAITMNKSRQFSRRSGS